MENDNNWYLNITENQKVLHFKYGRGGEKAQGGGGEWGKKSGY